MPLYFETQSLEFRGKPRTASGVAHSACVKRARTRLGNLLGDRVVFGVQDPIHLSDSEPEPDISVLKPRDDFYVTAKPVPEDVLLLVEVSDSSLEFDREVKGELYAEAGIPEYWIVNPEEACVEIHRDPQRDGTWRDVRTAKRGDSIEMSAPLGFFTVRDPAREAVFVATGTGIAPFRSMAPDYLMHPHAKQLTLLFGVRHEATIYYRGDFERLAATRSKFRFWPTLSRAEASWTSRTGHVQAHLDEAIGDRSDLKPGVHITALNAVKKEDGSIEAPRLNVGRDGLVPQ